MHIEDEQHLLMIHPVGAPSAEPVIDDLTRRMAGVLNVAELKHATRGFHCCTGRGCKATSDNVEHHVGRLYMTNSLAVHYLAHHREDVPLGELAKVAAFGFEWSEDPTPEQLSGRRSR